MIIRCPVCGAQYEISQPGKYQCTCGGKFMVEGEPPDRLTAKMPESPDIFAKFRAVQKKAVEQFRRIVRTGFFRKYWKWIAGVATVLLLLQLFSCGSSESVAEYRKRIVARLNQELDNPSHEMRKIVEKAHWTVAVTSAEVISCKINTRDGSQNAGRDGSNVKSITMQIQLRWDGFFHKNGYSILELRYEGADKKLTKAKIIQTNAVVNSDDPQFWYTVGSCIGFLLF